MAAMNITTIKTNNIAQYSNLLSGAFAVASFGVLPISTTLTDVFLALALLLLIIGGDIKSKTRMITNNPIALLFLVFFGLFLLGATYSSAPWHDIQKSLLKNAKLLYGALLIPIFIHDRWRRHAINTMIIVATSIMLLSYLKVFGIYSITDRYQDAAVFKSHIQTNFLMAFYCYLLSMKCCNDPTRKVLWGMLLIAAICKTLLFSQGRSGYIIFALLMVLFGWQRFSWRGVLASFIAVAMLCGGALLVSKDFQQRFDKIMTDTHQYQQGNAQTSVGLRISFYKNAVKLAAVHPIIGSGTGSLISRYASIEHDQSLRTHNVHNEYLNITIQLGLVGLGFLLIFFSTIYVKSVTLPREYRDLAQAVLLAIAAGCLINSWLMDTMQGHFFAMMMALCFGAYGKTQITK